MIKHLLTCAAIAAASLSASAAEITLWEGSCNFGTSWSESFGVPASDLSVLDNESAVLTFHYTLDTDCSYWQYKPCSNGSGWTPLEAATELGNSYQCISVEAGSTKTDLPLGAKDIATIKENGLRLQGYGMTVTKVTYVTDKTIDENLLWEGEFTFSSWNQGPALTPSKLNAGDILKLTFSEAGSGSQVIVKGSNWANLLGSAKIDQKDIATGSVIVGVTQEMLDNCGGSIFGQGDGGCVLTKIERAGTFDAKGVVAYGERFCGTSIFTVIPETATRLSATFASAVEYAQLMNSSWTDQEAASTSKTNNDGTVTYTFTLTPAIIAAVNKNKEVIINSNGKLLSLFYPAEGESSIADIELNADDAPVEFFNLQGVRVENPESGLYIRRQGNKVSKVIIR